MIDNYRDPLKSQFKPKLKLSELMKHFNRRHLKWYFLIKQELLFKKKYIFTLTMCLSFNFKKRLFTHIYTCLYDIIQFYTHIILLYTIYLHVFQEIQTLLYHFLHFSILWISSCRYVIFTITRANKNFASHVSQSTLLQDGVIMETKSHTFVKTEL